MEHTLRQHLKRSRKTFDASNHSLFGEQHDTWEPLSSETERTLGISQSPDHLLLSTFDCASPAEPIPSSKVHPQLAQDQSISEKEPMEEVLWHHELARPNPEQKPSLLLQDTLQPVFGGKEPRQEVLDDTGASSSSILQPVVDAGLRKRRRGRPRLNLPDAYKSDTPLATVSELRRSQLEKNRLAAEKCRRRQKERTAGLLDKASLLSTENEALKREERTLRERLFLLKNEILSHAECNSSTIDAYIDRAAENQVATEVASKYTLARKDSGQASDSTLSDNSREKFTARECPNALHAHKESVCEVATYTYDLELLDAYVDVEEG